MSIPILSRRVDWYCPNCGKQETTVEARPHTRFHICPKLHGLTAPMIEQGVQAKVEARLRDDFVGNERVQTAPDDGKPYMSVVTTRDNGTDAIVFAPTATMRADAPTPTARSDA